MFELWAWKCIGEGSALFKQIRVARLSNYVLFVASFRKAVPCFSTGFHLVWFTCRKGRSTRGMCLVVVAAGGKGRICLSHSAEAFSTQLLVFFFVRRVAIRSFETTTCTNAFFPWNLMNFISAAPCLSLATVFLLLSEGGDSKSFVLRGTVHA